MRSVEVGWGHEPTSVSKVRVDRNAQKPKIGSVVKNKTNAMTLLVIGLDLIMSVAASYRMFVVAPAASHLRLNSIIPVSPDIEGSLFSMGSVDSR